MIPKKIKITISWLMFGFLLSSHSCEDSTGPNYYYRANIFYRNAKGDDLLDPSVSNHFEIGKIKINGYTPELRKMDSGTNWSSLGYPVGYNINLDLSYSHYSGTDRWIITIDANVAISDTLTCYYQDGKIIKGEYNKVSIPIPGGQFPILITK